MCRCHTFSLVVFCFQFESTALLETKTTATQQLLQGRAEGGVNGLRWLDRQQQHQCP